MCTITQDSIGEAMLYGAFYLAYLNVCVGIKQSEAPAVWCNLALCCCPHRKALSCGFHSTQIYSQSEVEISIWGQGKVGSDLLAYMQ